MSSYRQILYHIVFRTKDSRRSLPQENIRELFVYVNGIIKAKHCVLHRINGMEDHIHILSDLHPSIALADYVKDIKISTSVWLKQNEHFPLFDGWSEGYAALTYSWNDREKIVNYIKRQQEHHKRVSYTEELRKELQEQGVKIDDRYFP